MTETEIESAGNRHTTLCRDVSFASTVLLMLLGSLFCSEYPGHVISNHFHTYGQIRGLKGQRSQLVCPYTYPTTSLKDLIPGVTKPYLLGGRPTNCTGCNPANLTGEKADFCKYEPPAAKMCSPAQLSRLYDYFLGRAINGSEWAEGMLRLSPCDLWPHILGRTLWLLGDSTTEHFMLALECFFIGWYELATSERFDGRVPASNNTEAMETASGWDGGQFAMVQPWCILLPKETRICFIRANTGLEWAQKVLPVFGELGGQPHDIIVGNFGLWAWGKPPLQDDLDALQNWVHNATKRPFMIWREISPQYFSTETGDFFGAVKPYKCQPIGGRDNAVQLSSDGSLHAQEEQLQVVLEGNWRNKASTAVVEALGIPVMRIWNESVPLWEYHYESIRNLDGTLGSGEDCTHSCHPSTYQIWTYSLYRVLSEYQDMLPQKKASEINGAGKELYTQD